MLNPYTYHLPRHSIALFPAIVRDQSKLLAYHAGQISDHTFTDLPRLLPANTTLVMNDSAVLACRWVFSLRDTTKQGEIFCLSSPNDPHWHKIFSARQTVCLLCLVRLPHKWKQQSVCIPLKDGTTLRATMVERLGGNRQTLVTFQWDNNLTFAEVCAQNAQVPLPPYIKRLNQAEDFNRYQTLYAQTPGSVAAPTAGLHFSKHMLETLCRGRASICTVCLHISADTFRPITASAQDHLMHGEYFIVSRETLQQLQNAPCRLAVGTSSLRTLESLYWLGMMIHCGALSHDSHLSIPQWVWKELPQTLSYEQSLSVISGFMENACTETITAQTFLMMTPPYRTQSVRGLITNFHQPNSPPLHLIASFIGEDWHKVYTHALANNYRFLSYGDSSILLL